VPLERDSLSRLHTRRQIERRLAFERGHLKLGAQRGLGERDVERVDEIETVALEALVW